MWFSPRQQVQLKLVVSLGNQVAEALDACRLPFRIPSATQLEPPFPKLSPVPCWPVVTTGGRFR